MKKQFNTIYIDIVGYCNANCYYCHSGVEVIEKNKNYMEPHDLNTILSKLLKNDYISPGQEINLYNWGDPILHPKLNDMAKVIGDLGLKFSISTNCSIVPKIEPVFAQYANTIMFSISGFSNETYKKMHGFNFDKIKTNMLDLMQKVRQNNTRVRFILLYHIYKYNDHELSLAEKFCNDHSIIFQPYNAILNHWWKLDSYIKNTISQEEKIKIDSELFQVENIKSIMESSPNDYTCAQYNYLNIDEKGNVITCCQIPKDYLYYSSGNLLTNDPIETIISKKNNHLGCKECTDSGLAYYLNNSFVKPTYQISLKQNFLQLSYKVINKLREFGFSK